MTRIKNSLIVFLATFVMLTGCAPEIQRPVMSLTQQLRASTPGFTDIRFFVDEAPAELATFLDDFRPAVSARPAYLALSGGGESGAYGAGYIVGWTESGQRPAFDLVTGISAGALIAPFAFIGAEQDPVLSQLFQSGIAARLNAPRSILSGVLGDGLLEAAPLREMVRGVVDQAIIEKVAARHRTGARLLVVTTNIDAERNVVWNMGAIAASGRPEARDLFVDIMVASASIPAVFPPVPVAMTVDGKSYDELHVDGGAIRQIYFFPEAFLADPDWRGFGGARPRIYAIANNEIAPRYDPAKRWGLGLAKEAFSSLIKSSLVQTLGKVEEFSSDQGMQFRLTYITQYIPSEADKLFDPQYMRVAFQLGKRAGQQNEWSRKLPVGTELLNAYSEAK